MEIIFLDAGTIGNVPNLNLLNTYGNVTYYENTNAQQIIERIRLADIVITNKVVLDEKTIEAATKLKMICVAATGTDNIDIEAAHKRDIKVKNVGGYSSNSVAQVTFSILLHLINMIPYFDSYVKKGIYSKSNSFTNIERSFFELNNKRFGIIGLGNIGARVAKIAEAFGAEIVFYSTSGKNNDQSYLQLGLNELLKTSDIVTIHAPLNKFTLNLISYGEIALMKPTSILINVGRGGIVNESDLAIALNCDLIGGAGIDVFEREPIRSDNPLLHVKDNANLVLTPHIGWASIESRNILMSKVMENIKQEYYKK